MTPDQTVAAREAEIERLRDEITHYKREMGHLLNHDNEAAFRWRWKLTPQEAVFLNALYARQGRLMTTDNILSALYPLGDEAERAILKVLVCRVRQRVGPGIIHTIWGQGYQLTPVGIRLLYQLLRGYNERQA